MNRKPHFPVVAVALFALASSAACQSLTFTPFHSTGIYKVGEKAGWTVSGAKDGKYTYEIKQNNFDTIKTGALDLSAGNATIETTLAEPAMIYVTVKAEGAADQKPIHLGAAIAPAQLQPLAPKPPDFDAFWLNKLQYLSITPMRPVVEPTKTDQAGVELSTVQLDAYGSRVHGYLAKPIKLGKFPALIIYQWAGVYALDPKWVTERAAEGWLAFDVDSHDMLPNQSTGVPQNYNEFGNTNRETSYFLFMYLRDARAVDYISSRPDWDGKTLVLMGTSMGGQQSLVTAGLRPQVSAVIVNEPAGCDIGAELHGRQAGYPFWSNKDPRAMATAPYFDAVNFASRIKAPVLAAMGFIDTTCPPAGIWTALNQVPGPKEAIPMIESDHNHITPEKQGAWNSRSKEALDVLLHGGTFEPNPEFTRK